MDFTLRRPEEELVAAYGDMLNVELELEDRMVTLGRDQVRKAIARAREQGNESGTRYGQTLIARSIDTVAEAIGRFMEKGKAQAGRRHIAIRYLEQVSSDAAAFIALRIVVDSLTGKKKLLQRVAVDIGKRLEDEARFAEFKQDNSKAYGRALEKAKRGTTYHRKKATMSGFERRFAEDEWDAWPEQDMLHLGMALIDIIVQTGLVNVADEINSRRDTVKVLEPTAKLVEWIEKESARSELLHPMVMPMVVKPLDWTDPFNGGYLSQDVQGRQALVKTSNTNYLTELADGAGTMPVVYESVNALQSTRWHINASVHQTLRDVWELGHPVAKLPSRDDISMCPCPSCGASIPLPTLNTRGSTEHGCFEDEQVLRQWKQKAYELHSENVSLRSKRLALAKTLRIAETYGEFEAIYFPYQLDFRGRIYAIPAFNPQGNDVTKGLLEFAEAKPINDGVAAGWLAIHGANVYGFDKASLEDRIQWVEDRTAEIVASAEDPMSNTFWHGADKPWQFLAFCFEWAGFQREGYGFMSRLPVALDGSCSGIQHFSAMLRDRIGGRAVNLLPSDKPSDIYQMVCDKVVEKLKLAVQELGSTIAYASSETLLPQGGESFTLKPEAIAQIAEATGGYSEGLMAAGWLSLQPNRKTTKRQVMTLPYGSTRYSCREYTEEWMMDRIKELGSSPFSKAVLFKASSYMSDLIWDSISEVVVAARQAMDWLQECAKVVADEELPVYWTTPVGFRVMQQYKNTSSRRVKTKLGDAIVKLSLSEEETTIDKRRMANAISPNVVHSLDASHLMMTVAYAKDNGIDAFSLIHDSFGTHAADTQLFSVCIRQAFVDLYEDCDVIEDLRAQFMRQVTVGEEGKIPACPSKGDLDLQEVLRSDFAFA